MEHCESTTFQSSKLGEHGDIALTGEIRFKCVHDLRTGESTFEAFIKDASQSAQRDVLKGETTLVGTDLGALFMHIAMELTEGTGNYSTGHVFASYANLHPSEYVNLVHENVNLVHKNL